LPFNSEEVAGGGDRQLLENKFSVPAKVENK
jgi:hypothetical protein